MSEVIESPAPLPCAGYDDITRGRLDAGAALAFAMYHCGDIDWIKAMPSTVCEAYMRATAAFAVDSRRLNSQGARRG